MEFNNKEDLRQFEYVKKILNSKIMIREKIGYYNRDFQELYDDYFLNDTFFSVSLYQFEEYLLFNEIEKQKKNTFSIKALNEVYAFEKELLKYLKKEDKYRDIYLLYCY